MSALWAGPLIWFDDNCAKRSLRSEVSKLIVCLCVCVSVCVFAKTVIFTLGICGVDILKSPNSIWRSVCAQILKKSEKNAQKLGFCTLSSIFWDPFLDHFLDTFFKLFWTFLPKRFAPPACGQLSSHSVAEDCWFWRWISWEAAGLRSSSYGRRANSGGDGS